MTRYTRVHLVPRGPFHFGGRGVGMERSDVGLAADSLFSALCVMIAQHRGEGALQDLLAQFPSAAAPDQAPFRLTSLMPYAADIHFLPYPHLRPLLPQQTYDLRWRKEFKRIEWVSEFVFRHLVRAETPHSAMDSNGSLITIHGGKVWLTQSERDALNAFVAVDSMVKQEPILWRTIQRSRVTVDRLSQASAVFGIGSTHFNKTEDVTAGLYTVVEWLHADADTQSLIQEAFVQLGEAGIGGERSYGHGHFEPEWDEMPDWLIGASAGRYFTTLSPYHPRIEERDVLGEGARYEITLRRGWLSLPGYQNLRRASVRMLADGSILRWPQTDAPWGELVDVTPDRLHMETGKTIYRYGLAFPVRVADVALQGGT